MGENKETKDAPVVESKETKPGEEKKETKPGSEEKKTEEKKEETVGDLLGTKKDDSKSLPEKKEVKMVPEATFLELKKDFKDLKKQLDEGTKTNTQVADEIKELAKEYNIDENFLGKLTGVLQQESKAEFDAELASRMKPIEEKERLEKLDVAFNGAYAKALEDYPEFKEVAKKEVIKALSLDPNNASKTFYQLMEETYGHLITGKRTIEPSGGHNRDTDEEIDFEKAQNNKEYFQKVMSDPVLKKKYNEGLPNRLSSVL